MSNRFIPAGAQSVPYPKHEAIVYLYTDKTGLPAALAYRYANTTPDWHESFKNAVERHDRILKWLDTL